MSRTTIPAELKQQRQTFTAIERRARFVYESARLAAEITGSHVVPEPWEERDASFRSQFREKVQSMAEVAEPAEPYLMRKAEEIHNSWTYAYLRMGWTYGETRDVEAKTHPDLVPFEELGKVEQEKDCVFIELVGVAARWIR